MYMLIELTQQQIVYYTLYVLTQVPPSFPERSMLSTFFPCDADRFAQAMPPEPPPMVMRS